MLQALVEAALQGQDQRLVTRCDVGGIVTAFEDFGVYDPDTLRSTLHASMPALQLALGGTAPPSFLPLLKTKLGEQETPAPPEAAAGACLPNVQLPTPSPAPPALAAQLPLVVTVRFNGRILAERTTLNVVPTATFEQVARARIQTALGAAEAHEYTTMQLAVSLFPTADHRPSEKSGAAISDTVAGAFALGYPHVLLAFSTPVYGCARRPATGVDATEKLMDAARAVHANLCLPVQYAQKEEGGTLNFELALYNAILEQCADEQLGVIATDRDSCQDLLHHGGAAGGAQAHGPARGRCKEEAEEGHEIGCSAPAKLSSAGHKRMPR